MQWFVTPMMTHGRASPAHVRQAARVRGAVVIADEAIRGRGSVRVARCSGQALAPLLDVRLLASAGGQWRLAGVEAVLDGVMSTPVHYAQVWTLEPAPVADLERAEVEVQRLLRELASLRGGAVG